MIQNTETNLILYEKNHYNRSSYRRLLFFISRLCLASCILYVSSLAFVNIFYLFRKYMTWNNLTKLGIHWFIIVIFVLILGGLFVLLLKKGKLAPKSRRQTAMFTFMALICFLSVNVVSGATEEPVLEDLLTERVLELYTETNGLGGFTDGSTFSANWVDTFDALETLEMLGSKVLLDDKQKDAIIRFIMNERITENQTTTINKTVEVEYLDEDNNTVIGERIDPVIAYVEETIDWWGSIQKSVEALRMLSLLDALSDSLLTTIESRILTHFGDVGLNWQLDQPGWNDLYWAIYKSQEWDLFHLLPKMGLLPLTPSTLDYIQGKDIEIEDEIRYSSTQPIYWSDLITKQISYNTLDTEQIPRALLPIPTLTDLFDPHILDLNYVPIAYLTVNWVDIWDEDGFLTISNFENRSYAIENELLVNETVMTEKEVITESGTVIKTIPETKERWQTSDLAYTLVFELVTEEGKIIHTHTSRINEKSTTSIRIPLQYLGSNTRYFAQAQIKQRIHEFNTSLNSPEMIVDEVNPDTGEASGRTYMDAPDIDGNVLVERGVKEGKAFYRIRVTAADIYDVRGEIVHD